MSDFSKIHIKQTKSCQKIKWKKPSSIVFPEVASKKRKESQTAKPERPTLGITQHLLITGKQA